VYNNDVAFEVSPRKEYVPDVDMTVRLAAISRGKGKRIL